MGALIASHIECAGADRICTPCCTLLLPLQVVTLAPVRRTCCRWQEMGQPTATIAVRVQAFQLLQVLLGLQMPQAPQTQQLPVAWPLTTLQVQPTAQRALWP